jgi:hypothetical protein
VAWIPAPQTIISKAPTGHLSIMRIYSHSATPFPSIRPGACSIRDQPPNPTAGCRGQHALSGGLNRDIEILVQNHRDHRRLSSSRTRSHTDRTLANPLERYRPEYSSATQGPPTVPRYRGIVVPWYRGTGGRLRAPPPGHPNLRTRGSVDPSLSASCSVTERPRRGSRPDNAIRGIIYAHSMD